MHSIPNVQNNQNSSIYERMISSEPTDSDTHAGCPTEENSFLKGIQHVVIITVYKPNLSSNKFNRKKRC